MRIASNPAFIILVLVAIHASPLFGQKQPKPSPPPETTEDSARWWTLTDEITPEKLRAIHEDIELHKERYREAVRAGTRPLLPKEQMELVRFFVDGSTHPELFPMWSVYSSFAAGFVYDEVDPRVSLAEFGFAGEVLETIADISIEYWREREILFKESEEEAKDLLEFVRLSKESLGEKRYMIAAKAKDATMFANATGYSVEQVEKFLERIWDTTLIDDLTRRTLPLIKEVLEPADWERFRRYLLEVQAPKMSAIAYAEKED